MASSVTARSGTSNRSRSGALERFQVLALDVGAFREGEMQGMGESDSRHLDRHAVVLQQQSDLLDQVVTEQRRLGDRGLVDAGFGHVAIGQRVSMGS